MLDFYAEDRSTSMALLIDTSGSMQDKIKEVHLAAGAFVDSLRPIDQALVIGQQGASLGKRFLG